MSVSEILNMISLISYILGAISLFLAIIFWVNFNIPAVIGDLTGRTARKSIESMRANNEKTGNKSFMPSKTNVDRGKLTSTMPDTDETTETLVKKKDVESDYQETGLLDENRMNAYDSEQTGLLTEEKETELLETDVLGTELLDDYNETGLLVEENATTLLDEIVEIQPTYPVDIDFVMLDEVMLIHTDEIIE